MGNESMILIESSFTFQWVLNIVFSFYAHLALLLSLPVWEGLLPAACIYEPLPILFFRISISITRHAFPPFFRSLLYKRISLPLESFILEASFGRLSPPTPVFMEPPKSQR